jgi:acyl dehydratase
MSEDDARPLGARVSLDMIGSSTGDISVAWTERDVMLYALGVGAGLGDPGRELGFTTENTAGVRLAAIPSFLTVLATALPPAVAGLDARRFLHAGQQIELARALPPSGCGTLESVVEEVLDKGAGALVTYAATLLGDDGDPSAIGRVRTSIFVRGAGGFGGPRGSAAKAVQPTGAPALRIEQDTRPEQALLYRLSGDRHRLHSDPAFAAENGFPRPILHGLCTYGIACRALINGVAEGDAGRLRTMEGRFSKPVFPGDRLTTEIWPSRDGEVFFRTLDGAGEPVIDAGVARISASSQAAT